jgi:hypothetical protein
MISAFGGAKMLVPTYSHLRGCWHDATLAWRLIPMNHGSGKLLAYEFNDPLGGIEEDFT